jgi:hypothetical protein
MQVLSLERMDQVRGHLTLYFAFLYCHFVRLFPGCRCRGTPVSGNSVSSQVTWFKVEGKVEGK